MQKEIRGITYNIPDDAVAFSVENAEGENSVGNQWTPIGEFDNMMNICSIREGHKIVFAKKIIEEEPGRYRG